VSQRVALPTGTLTLPAGYTHEALRGTDSYPGVIRRADGGVVIHYDIGPMAGARVHPSRRGEYRWFVEHEVGGHRAYTALFVRDGRRRIATTVLGDAGSEALGDPLALPANFEAELRGGADGAREGDEREGGEREVAEFMLIVTSYQPNRRR
jgi:hypothetical protein